MLSPDLKQWTYFKLIFFSYYNFNFAFQHFLERFSFQFKLSMGIMGFFFLSFIPVMVDITLLLQCTRDVWFPFFFTQSHSCPVPFENYFWRICKRRLPIHKANTFTKELANSHCRQIWAALWIPAVSHFEHTALQTPPWAPPPLLHHWLSFKALNGVFPFYHLSFTPGWDIFPHPFVIF